VEFKLKRAGHAPALPSRYGVVTNIHEVLLARVAGAETPDARPQLALVVRPSDIKSFLWSGLVEFVQPISRVAHSSVASLRSLLEFRVACRRHVERKAGQLPTDKQLRQPA